MNCGFAQNLRLLCSYFGAASEACRKVGINRSLFNRYLSGEVFPRAHNMRKICDFFGVEEYEIVLPKAEFAEIVRVRPSRKAARGSSLPTPASQLSHIESISQHAELRRYMGYYNTYYYSMSYPDKVLLGLMSVTNVGASTVCERRELLGAPGRLKSTPRCRYLGQVFFLKDRLFVVEYESLTSNELGMTVLYPSYETVQNLLFGLKLGVPATGYRAPAARPVVLEYLGTRLESSQRLRAVGLYDPDDPALSAEIVTRLGDPPAAQREPNAEFASF